MDLTALHATLSLPAGAHLIWEQHQMALIVVSHEHPNQVTIERRPLGAYVSLEEFLRSAYLAGALPAQQSPAALTSSESKRTPEKVEREPCPNGCGTMLIPGKPGRHLTTCPNRPAGAAEESCGPN